MRILKFVAVLLLLICFAVGMANELPSHVFTYSISGYNMKLHYFRNLPPDSVNHSIKRAIIQIHGSDRHPGSEIEHVIKATQEEGQIDSTIILAPMFLIEEDIDNHSLNSSFLFWTGYWKIGHKSSNTTANPRPVRISSYSLLDSMIQMLVDHMPSLECVILAGHSAGGQFSNRYSIGSSYPLLLRDNYNIHYRTFIANPSSFLYFNSHRVIEGTLDQFEPPNGQGCAYHNYPYGLVNRNSYMSQKNESQLALDYAELEVIYMASEDDTAEAYLDVSCGAMFEGKNRIMRAKIYYNYVHYVLDGLITGNQIFQLIPNLGHSSRGTYTSDLFKKWAFSSTIMMNVDTMSVHEKEPLSLCKIYPNPAIKNFNLNITQAIYGNNYDVRIIDMNGQTAYKESITATNNVINKKIYPRELAKGVYFVKIVCNDKVLDAKKILLMQ